MLVEFTFENFRAARNEQRFSMVAGTGKEHRTTHVFRPHSVPKDIQIPELLRSTALYGANASGKTNFVRAFHAFRKIITESASWAPGRTIPVTPFLFSDESATQPTAFEAIFVNEGTRYQYGFLASSKRIHEEWLFAFPVGKAQRWFNREFNKKSGEYEVYFGPNLLGEKDTWRKATRSNALLLSTAVQLNSEQLLPVYQWFEDKLRIVQRGGKLHPAYTLEQFIGGAQKSILEFLQKADFSIEDLEIEQEKAAVKDLSNELFEEILLPDGTEDDGGHRVRLYKVKSVHKTVEGTSVSLNFKEESDGTQKMLSLAGPWLDTLANGYTLVVDELHQNLHPKLLEHLVRMFNDPSINRQGAQLVFTTHNTSILSQDVLRRDQVWLFERDKAQASSLYPLSDFKVRKGSNLELAYLSGRFGGLPFVRKMNSEVVVENG